MDITLRNDKVEIEGYVNAVERNSRPLWSRVGQFIERICKGAFKKALKRNEDVHILLNHDWSRDLGSTKKGNLELEEDNIGLRAKATICDKDVIEKARNGDLIGWSFGFSDVDVENSNENGIPTRAVKDLDLYEVSILDREKTPAYEGNLITARSDEKPLQFRSEPFFNGIKVNNIEKRGTENEENENEELSVPSNIKPKIDYSKYENLIKDLKVVSEILEIRYNPNHDGKTGRFSFGGGGGSSSSSSSSGSGSSKSGSSPLKSKSSSGKSSPGKNSGSGSSNSSSGGGGGSNSDGRADENTQAEHQKATKELSSSKYPDGTYNVKTLKPVSYNSGYQVTFCRIGDNYSPKEYAAKVNEFLDISSDKVASAGKFQSTPEVSFHVKDKSVAIKKAKKYNQISVWDWKKFREIKTGGTGRRNLNFEIEALRADDMNKVEKYKELDRIEENNDENTTNLPEREALLKTMTNEEIDELINWMQNIQGKIYLSKFKKK